MTLLDDLAQERIAKGPRCAVGGWLSTLSPEDRTEVEDALRSDYASTVIHRLLTKRWAVIFRFESLQRHRGGRCACRSLTS